MPERDEGLDLGELIGRIERYLVVKSTAIGPGYLLNQALPFLSRLREAEEGLKTARSLPSGAGPSDLAAGLNAEPSAGERINGRKLVEAFFALRLSEKRDLLTKYSLPLGDPMEPEMTRWQPALLAAKNQGLLVSLARDLGALAPPADAREHSPHLQVEGEGSREASNLLSPQSPKTAHTEDEPSGKGEL